MCLLDSVATNHVQKSFLGKPQKQKSIRFSKSDELITESQLWKHESGISWIAWRRMCETINVLFIKGRPQASAAAPDLYTS